MTTVRSADGRMMARGEGNDRPTLITGGAGFIGTNLAHRLASSGEKVILYDNLSRRGVERNLSWVRAVHGDQVTAVIADVRDAAPLRKAVFASRRVYHLAAQVAVTTSIADPLDDFAVNAGGTLTLLEALRAAPEPRPLVFTSTNKVYGAVDDLPLQRLETRYVPARDGVRHQGFNEQRPLDFHSPYGCSKGAADQYVIDYARSYGLPALVFRMSCIYGPHQYGTEDQGWVAHFLLRALADEPITLYGDGRQVRDLLYVDDLVDALLLAQDDMARLGGRAYNIGGGVGNTLSLLELIERIANLNGRRPTLRRGPWRTGDQRYYVSDCSRFMAATGWQPRVSPEDGVRRLYHWLLEHNARSRLEPAAPQRAAGMARAVADGPQRPFRRARLPT